MLPAGPQSPAPPYAVAGVPGTWIVDYVPRFHLGPVVPQLPYVPTGTPDQIAQHYRRLRAPIWFINNNGSIGISLVNALSGQTSSLLGDRNPVGGTRQNTYFSLNVLFRCDTSIQEIELTMLSVAGVPGVPKVDQSLRQPAGGRRQARATGSKSGQFREGLHPGLLLYKPPFISADRRGLYRKPHSSRAIICGAYRTLASLGPGSSSSVWRRLQLAITSLFCNCATAMPAMRRSLEAVDGVCAQ